MAKVILNNSGTKIVAWQSKEGFYLRAYENGNFKEQSVKNPNIEERGIFIQRYY
jgi:hypothetical protein